MTSRFVGHRAPWVRSADLDGEVSLFDPRTGRALALNHTAAAVWRCADGRPLTDLVGTVAAEYGVEPEAVHDEVVEVLAALEDAGVVVAP